MPKVSVIVPVYKVEKYVSKCIESILNQTYTDWELILVDDGTPDRSGAICEEYAHKDSRISVYHKENGGVSSARNLGIEEAHGEWITFVDADDWLDKNALSQCLPYMGEYDVIRFSMNRVMKEDGKDVRPFVIKVEPKEDYLARIVARETILGVCGGAYRRSLFIENNIRFDHTLVNGEDWVVLAKLVSLSHRCKILQLALYNYVKYNETSCTADVNFSRELSAVRALNIINDSLGGKMDDKLLFKSLSQAKCDLIYHFFSTLISTGNSITRDEFSEYVSNAPLGIKHIYHSCLSMKKKILLIGYSNSCVRNMVRIFYTR